MFTLRRSAFPTIMPFLSFAVTYLSTDAALEKQVTEFADQWNSGQQLFTAETSGSTGTPKQLTLKREQLLASAKRTLDFFGLRPGNTALLAISPATIGGKMMIVRALTGGLHLFVVPPQANPLAQLPDGQTIDFVPLVPLQLKTIVRENPTLLQRIGTVLLGGSPVSPDLEEQLSALHQRIFIGFGMTETVSHIAMRKIGDSVYTALNGVQFSEKNDALVISDSELGIDQLQTNDSVSLISSEQFEWFGRTDFTINSGGVKIHPEQLERLLEGVIDVPFFIAARPDDTFGEICILVIDSPEKNIDLKAIQDICRKKLGKYSVPKALIYAPMVYGKSNKINRNATLQQSGVLK